MLLITCSERQTKKARRREAISIQISVMSDVDQDETGGGVHVSETLAYRTFVFVFVFFLRRAAFRWQCRRGNMNAEKQEILVSTCSVGSVL